jgi:predicted nucleic acid-binding protein
MDEIMRTKLDLNPWLYREQANRLAEENRKLQDTIRRAHVQLQEASDKIGIRIGFQSLTEGIMRLTDHIATLKQEAGLDEKLMAAYTEGFDIAMVRMRTELEDVKQRLENESYRRQWFARVANRLLAMIDELTRGHKTPQVLNGNGVPLSDSAPTQPTIPMNAATGL